MSDTLQVDVVRIFKSAEMWISHNRFKLFMEGFMFKAILEKLRSISL